ncbi:MAG: hypothetical protein AAF281_03555 [Pseudomonadota bacterium]
MDVSLLLPALFLVTCIAVVAFAVVSRKHLSKRQQDDDAPKSTLAADAPDHRS